MRRPFHSASQDPSLLPLMMTACRGGPGVGLRRGLGGEERERQGPCLGGAQEILALQPAQSRSK